MQELEEHVCLYPSVTEFVKFRTEQSRLVELDDLARTHVPHYPRPKLVRSGHGSPTLNHSMKEESPAIFGTARVFFVRGEIVGMSAEMDGFREELVTAIPMDTLP